MQRIVRNVERNSDLIRQTTSQTMQQCTTTGQVDTAFYDIGVQLRRRGLQGLKDSTFDLTLFSRQCAIS